MTLARASLLLTVTAAAVACDRGGGLPEAGSPEHGATIAAFHSGIAALQAGEAGIAGATFRRVTELAPDEPAGWANLAVTELVRREYEAAADHVDRALGLEPEDARLHRIAALVAGERGQRDAALAHLRSAVAADPEDLRALFLLARSLKEEGDAGVAEARSVLDRILALAPRNLPALLARARLAAAQRDAEGLEEDLQRIGAEAGQAGSTTTQIDSVRTAADSGDFDRAAAGIGYLETELYGLPTYREDQDALRIGVDGADALVTRFLRLPAAPGRSAPPDPELAFVPESLSVGEGTWDFVRGLWLGDEVPLALIAANQRTVNVGVSPEQSRLFEFPGGAGAGPVPPTALALLDYDYDFSVDLALAGAGGIRLLRQDAIGAFSDVTARAIPADVADGAYTGVWAADLDMEGDVDLVLGRVGDAPLVLWNLGDERFEPGAAFEGVTGLREFLWADLDGDGDPDAVLVDETARLHVFLNERFRTPRFRPYPVPDTLASALAIAAADLNRDATLDLVVLQTDGTVRRLSRTSDGWESAALTRWSGSPTGDGSTRIFLVDLDNNGDLDLVVSSPGGSSVWLATPDGLQPHDDLALHVTDIVDLGGEGRLDLVGLAPDGATSLLANRGGVDYYSTSIRPRAARAFGDRRINSLGIGGEIEVRAGFLYQKQPITGPTVHFGLGEHANVDVARILWPNGTVQAEFNISTTNEAVMAIQRLKGSCPWVFAFDGDRMGFVTDFLWRTALGLRINAQGDASVIHSEDWIRIRGDQLVARNGSYDIRITGELWETHFFDHVSLMVVDHPADTEVLVDERFTLPAPEPTLHAMGPLRPVAWARDHRGRDVTALVEAIDERFVDGFELGPYQGIAEEHYVEVALEDGSAPAAAGGSDEPAPGAPLWLVASGWVYPTDGSINVAIGQGGHARPRGVRVEVPDGAGGWRVLEPDLGFPAGKTKTILIDLRDAFAPGAERRVRLGTNMEIYWDRIAWTGGRPDAEVRTWRLAATTAELRYRGFSEVHAAGRRAPELPDYERVASVSPLWRDLEGYHTRFGDVRVLIEEVDDRYVIMNAGDELLLEFPAIPPPPNGWTRDFVLIGDGWVKDGDFNNGFSRTVLPLPYHGLETYDRAPERLEDDPAYQRHPEDWKVFHTRYVTPERFHRALLPTP